jgi:hypothetical protein
VEAQHGCEASALQSEITCEGSCWSANSEGFKSCASMTLHILPIDNCCFGTFCECVIAADATYLDLMWPAMDDFHSAMSANWSAFVSCHEACDHDDGVCIGACEETSRADAIAAYINLYGEEVTHAETRNDLRGTCVLNLATEMGLGCRLDGQLKVRDMKAEVQRFFALQKLWTKMLSLGCPASEFGGMYAAQTSCRNTANVDGALWWITNRTENRLSDCIDHWDRLGKAVHRHVRGRCQAACGIWDTAYDALCTNAMDGCVTSCCALSSEDQAACLLGCEIDAACALPGGECESALVSCLDACAPDYTIDCVEACSSDWQDCISEDFGGGTPFAFDNSNPDVCFGQCEIHLFLIALTAGM